MDAPYSCREGTCGTCQTAVVAGIPQNRNSTLLQQERTSSRTMMICCGSSKCPRLVLDTCGRPQTEMPFISKSPFRSQAVQKPGTATFWNRCGLPTTDDG
ncbi:2Fe-2S iron-sulfur cluster-binding protein [Cupriavidus necator]|uniref:2Fe-2S iron-sulfur cluster-binding protein n=1 Tax=Cupriavidus necator TaxID=106590 RepID=UPI001EE66C65|nr:2Fe-2S iron-sulfur cluster binding domain-containing protein [Cupriavidus necator]